MVLVDNQARRKMMVVQHSNGRRRETNRTTTTTKQSIEMNERRTYVVLNKLSFVCFDV